MRGPRSPDPPAHPRPAGSGAWPAARRTPARGCRPTPAPSSTLPALVEPPSHVETGRQKGRRRPVGIDLRPEHQRHRGGRHVSLAVQVSAGRRPDEPGAAEADRSRRQHRQRRADAGETTSRHDVSVGGSVGAGLSVRARHRQRDGHLTTARPGTASRSPARSTCRGRHDGLRAPRRAQLRRRDADGLLRRRRLREPGRGGGAAGRGPTSTSRSSSRPAVRRSTPAGSWPRSPGSSRPTTTASATPGLPGRSGAEVRLVAGARVPAGAVLLPVRGGGLVDPQCPPGASAGDPAPRTAGRGVRDDVRARRADGAAPCRRRRQLLAVSSAARAAGRSDPAPARDRRGGPARRARRSSG